MAVFHNTERNEPNGGFRNQIQSRMQHVTGGINASDGRRRISKGGLVIQTASLILPCSAAPSYQVRLRRTMKATAPVTTSAAPMYGSNGTRSETAIRAKVATAIRARRKPIARDIIVELCISVAQRRNGCLD